MLNAAIRYAVKHYDNPTPPPAESINQFINELPTDIREEVLDEITKQIEEKSK